MSNNKRLLVAVDVDGTLLNTEFDDILREREINAIEAVRDAGHIVSLCTGRNTRSVDGLLEKSNWQPIDLPMILLNGALVKGIKSKEPLLCKSLDKTRIVAIIKLFRQFDVVPMVYGRDEDGGVLHHEALAVNDILNRYLSVRQETVGAIHVIDDLLELPFDHALEVGSIDQKEKILALTEAINKELAGQVRVINTESLMGNGRYYWAEVYADGCDKGSAVKILAKDFGIQMSEVIAIGDNYNDLDMFAAAGVSVAMGNGPADVREQADFVTDNVDSCGAAQILEKIAAGKFPA